MPGKYEKVKNLIPAVMSMVEEGKTRQEIAERNLLKHYKNTSMVLTPIGEYIFAGTSGNSSKSKDSSYIKTGQGVLYLSIFRDLYDNSIVSYQTGHRTKHTAGAEHDSVGEEKGKDHCTAATPQ